MLRLHFRNGSQMPTWINKPAMQLGSAADADIRLPDDQPPALAVLETTDEGTRIRPATPAVAIVLNGQPVPAAGSLLKAGDTLRCGSLELDVADPLASVTAMKTSVEKLTGKPLAAKPRGQAARSPWKLVGVGGLLDGKEYPLAGTLVLGRDTEADIVIAGTHLSRRHVQLTVTDGALQARDLGSSNGTFINGKRTSEGFLKNGDELRIDTFHFRVAGPSDDRDKTVVAQAIDIPNPVRNPDDIHWKTKPTSRGNNYRTGVTDSVDATAGPSPLPWVMAAVVVIAASAAAWFMLA